ncbi:COG0388 Predicted amidohydrolase [Mycobacteriaceae bacterium]|jgi:predicted amidohydrolase
MRIACAQILSSTDPSSNLAIVEDYTRRAAESGARLVVFPEATMCRLGVPLAPIAEPIDGRWADAVRKIAAAADLTVVVGMFTPASDDRVTNTLLATGGGVENRYDKIHLYDAFGFTESATVAPGGNPVVISVDGIGVGVTLCYDVRFPSLYTELADRGASVITVSASWGAGPGKLDQWTLLARARALDTTCFLAAAGQAYPGPDLAESSTAPTGVGGSLVASPVGEVLVSAGSSPQLLVCDLDIGGLEAVRKTLPVLNNRAVIAQTGRIASR